MRRSRKAMAFQPYGEGLGSSSAFLRLFLTSFVSSGHETKLKASPYQECVVMGEIFLWFFERKFRDLRRLKDDQRQQDFVPDLLKLKCAPCQAEKEKTAFTGDVDGWISGMVSRRLFRFFACWAWPSTRRVFDILAIPRRRHPLDIPVMGVSHLQPCRFRR